MPVKTSYYQLPRGYPQCCSNPDLRREGFNSVGNRRVWCVSCDCHYSVNLKPHQPKDRKINMNRLTIPADSKKKAALKAKRLNQIPEGTWEKKYLR